MLELISKLSKGIWNESLLVLQLGQQADPEKVGLRKLFA